MVLRSGGQTYRYGYQGAYAEKDGETDWNAFELRMYDSRIARWMSTDPAGQFASPYVAMGGDPVNNTDADGGSVDDWGGKKNADGTTSWTWSDAVTADNYKSLGFDSYAAPGTIIDNASIGNGFSGLVKLGYAQAYYAATPEQLSVVGINNISHLDGINIPIPNMQMMPMTMPQNTASVGAPHLSFADQVDMIASGPIAAAGYLMGGQRGLMIGYGIGGMVNATGGWDVEGYLSRGNFSPVEETEFDAVSAYKNAISSFKGGKLTNVGRAVTKHPEYFGFKSTEELMKVHRTPEAINNLGSSTIKNILRNGIRTTGAGGRYPNGWATYTLPNGNAASWGLDGTFIGFRGVK